MELHCYICDDGNIHCFEKQEDDVALCDRQATSKTLNKDGVVIKDNVCDECVQEITKLFFSGKA